MRGGALVAVEPGDVGLVDVDLRGTRRSSLGHRAADPGPSLIQLAAADHSPCTSGVSPSSGCPSGVIEISPLIAYRMPTRSSPSSSGISSRACFSCGSKSSWVNGISVGESTASSMDGISSGGTMIGRCAYEPTSMSPPCWRSYMLVSTSRTIG